MQPFFTLLFYVFIGDKIYKYRNRPIIDAYFDSSEPEYFHWTIRNTGAGGFIELIPTYYIRLKVKNIGKETLKNVEVVLEKAETSLTLKRPFMPLNLSWSGFIVPITRQGDIKRTVSIPQGQFRVVDVIEVLDPKKTRVLARKLKQASNLEAERFIETAKGFRSCSILPNTISDVYPSGKYTLHLGIYADDAKPKLVKMSIDYNRKWTKDIKKMRESYLKVKLLS